jgi:hypothetical protein
MVDDPDMWPNEPFKQEQPFALQAAIVQKDDPLPVIQRH